MAASSVICFCPRESITSFGNCSFHIQCTSYVDDVRLPPRCQGSTNYPVHIDLILNNATDSFDNSDNNTEQLLASVISFRAHGIWPQTNLSMLEYMPSLRFLYLNENQIGVITGRPFSHLFRLEHIDLSHNNLSNIAQIFQLEKYLNRMRTILLAYNVIDEIPNNAFKGLSSLEELDLSYNQISILTNASFLTLNRLKILKLNNNRITNLNGAVDKLNNLKHLYLKGNQIQNINTNTLNVINDLETFDISSNQLEDLQAVVFVRHWRHLSTNSICKILLSNNQITKVPNVTTIEFYDRYIRSFIGQKSNVIDVTTELDLSKNAISEIGYDAFRPLVRLVSLNLSCNKIIDFIVNPKYMTHIKYLNLNNNYILHLYMDSFRYMANLENLDLSHNYLESIPVKPLKSNSHLKYFNLTNNKIEMVESLRIKMFHPDGGVLDLSNNSISKLYIPHGEGLRLTILILRFNKISNPSSIFLRYQNDLEKLDMSNNFIAKLEEHSLYLPITLSSLDLSNNLIVSISAGSFNIIERLKTLRLGCNKLQNIEYGAFQGLKDLSNLDLSYNNITYLDSKVMIDLKSLKVLSLKYNGLYMLDYKGWLGHQYKLTVYLEGNRFSCDWLATALNDYDNGYSMMKPRSAEESLNGTSIGGVPCVKGEIENMARMTSVSTDERLLVIVQRILRAVEEQNSLYEKMFLGFKAYSIISGRAREHLLV
ncbi:unnamed protein product [Diatraea saccharalis]|uniref:Uncharacterized protein n=1 Tax=Diatraea saccharalis TaxID=40085 RepID=A0A9N9WKQ3_9NEOP|nr:unnamed protein product [Diatraea saccharalis]